MNYVLVSDPHFTSKTPRMRTDEAVKTCIRKLRYICKTAKEYNAPVIFAGDITNTPRDFLISYHLSNIMAKSKLHFFTVKGQHDYYHRTNKPSIVLLLRKLGLLQILTRDITSLNGDRLFGVSWNVKGDIPEPKRIKMKSKVKRNILVIHAPITEDPLFPGHENIDAHQFLHYYEHHYDLILVGDPHIPIHIHTDRSTLICTGPVYRRSKNEFGLRPHLYIYNSEQNVLHKHQIPHNEDFKEEAIEREEEISSLIDTFTNAVKGSKVSNVNALEILDQTLPKMKYSIRKAVGELRHGKVRRDRRTSGNDIKY